MDLEQERLRREAAVVRELSQVAARHGCTACYWPDHGIYIRVGQHELALDNAHDFPRVDLSANSEALSALGKLAACANDNDFVSALEAAKERIAYERGAAKRRLESQRQTQRYVGD